MSLIPSSSTAGQGGAPPLGLASPLGLLVSEKLSKNNLQLWKLQVLPTIRGAQLEGYLDGTVALLISIKLV
jgi:hypothetical protein